MEFNKQDSMKYIEQKMLKISLSLSLSLLVFLLLILSCSEHPPCHQMQEWPEFLHLRTC